jgi:hypothetical protein
VSSRGTPARYSGVAAALFALCLVAAGPAQADEYDALLTRAVAVKERALSANDPATWLEASSLFQQADAMRSTPETKYELAFAAEHLRQHDLAVELYQLCLEQGISGRARAHARQFVDQYAASMARLELRGEAGTTVSIGGVLRGTLPLDRPMVVFPGRVTLAITDPRGARRTRMVELRSSELSRLDVQEPTAAPAPPASTPPKQASAPTALATAPPPRPREVVESSGSNGLGVGLLVTGAVVAVASGVTLLVANKNLDSARDHLATTCTDLLGTDRCHQTSPAWAVQAQSDVDAISSWKAVRVGAYIGLGVGLVSAAIASAVLASSPRRKAPVQAEFAFGPANGALLLNGRF